MPLPIIGAVAGTFWVSLQVWLFTVIPALAVRLMIALGIGFVTYSGGDLLITQAESYVLNQLAGTPSKVYTILQMAGIAEGIRIVFAAAGAYITIRTTMGAYAMFRPNPNVLRA